MEHPSVSNSPATLGPVLYGISAVASFGLIAIGILFICDHHLAAQSFGVPLPAGGDDPYISVAAGRDVAVGALALVFTLLRDRRALGLTILLGAIIPLGDGLVVLARGPTPLPYLFVHWGGVAGCLIFAFILLSSLAGQRRTSSK